MLVKHLTENVILMFCVYSVSKSFGIHKIYYANQVAFKGSDAKLHIRHLLEVFQVGDYSAKSYVPLVYHFTFSQGNTSI